MIFNFYGALPFLCVAVYLTSATSAGGGSHANTSVVDCLNGKKVPHLTESSATYENYSSPYNLRLQYKPAVIVLAEDNGQVSDSVLCAAKHGLKVQAKSGGHSYSSYSTGGKDGAFIIDLQKFQAVSLDKKTNIAKFGAGLRLGNLALALSAHGRALPHGTCTAVGVGGHFTVGGDGFTARAYGLAIDSIVAMDVVLANGSVVHATSTSYPDIFFAMRGAGHSFGIATTFWGQTFAHPKVLTGVLLIWPELVMDAGRQAAALTHLQNFASNASSGLDRNFQFDVGMVVNHSAGKPLVRVFYLKGVYLGPVATFNRTVLPELMRGLPTPGSDDSGASFIPSTSFIKEYGWAEALIDANYDGPIMYPQPGDPDFVPTPDHDKYYTKSLITPALPAQALKDLTTWAVANAHDPVVTYYYTMSLQGGYDNQIFLESKEAHTAFRRRNATWVFENTGIAKDLGDSFPPAGISLVEDMTAQVTNAMEEGSYGAYQAYVDSQLTAEEAGTLNYGDELFAKLKVFKMRIDPGNLFSNPQSIPVGK